MGGLVVEMDCHGVGGVRTGLLLKIPLLLLAVLFMTVAIVIIVTAFLSCDLDQINDPGGWGFTAYYPEVTFRQIGKGLQVDFSFGINNLHDTPIVGYAFAWVSNEPLCPGKQVLWPVDASPRELPPSPEYPGDPNQPRMGAFKEGYYFNIPGRRSKSMAGSVLLQGVEAQDIESDRSTRVVVVLYDVFGEEQIRLTYPEPDIQDRADTQPE